MIIDKQEWERQAGKWIYQRKKHEKLLYAHFLISIPILVWMLRLDHSMYELTWVGSILLNVNFLFGVLMIVTHFQLNKQRRVLLQSHEMMEMLEEPKDQWGKTNEERNNTADAPDIRSVPDRVSARKS